MLPKVVLAQVESRHPLTSTVENAQKLMQEVVPVRQKPVVMAATEICDFRESEQSVNAALRNRAKLGVTFVIAVAPSRIAAA